MGDQEFYGTSKTVDSSKVFTIVTQFVTVDGTNTGALKQINRFYVQNGKVIPNSVGKSHTHLAISPSPPIWHMAAGTDTYA